MSQDQRRPQGSGGLRQRGGRWQSSAADPRTGKTKWKTWPADMTPRQVQRAHGEWVLEVRSGRAADPRATVAAFAKRWLTVRESDMKAATWARHRANCRTIERHIGSVRMADLDTLTIIESVQTMRRLDGMAYAPDAVASIKGTLVQLCADAVAWRVIPANPTAGVRLPRADPSDRSVPTTEQVHAICDGETDPLWRVCWELLAGTGARPGEVRALRWGDVDLPGRKLTIARTVTQHGGVERIGATTKTRRSRNVGIDDHLAAVLSTWRSYLAEHGGLYRARDDAPVLPSIRSQSGVVSAGAMAKHWALALQRLNDDPDVPDVDPAVTPHAVRHWVASTLMADGVAVQLIAAQLGHSITEVELRYGKHAPVDQALAVATRLPARRSAQA